MAAPEEAEVRNAQGDGDWTRSTLRLLSIQALSGSALAAAETTDTLLVAGLSANEDAESIRTAVSKRSTAA